MTRIQVSGRSDRNVFRSHAAAGNTLDDAWPACQVDHVVVEGEIASFAFSFAFQHFRCQSLVFRQKLRDIRFLQCIRRFRRRDNRLDGQLLEAQIRHVNDVAGKVCVVMGVCTAHVIILLVSGFCQFAECRQDGVISTAALVCLSHIIVD